MKKTLTTLFAAVVLVFSGYPASAQESSENNFKQQFIGQFDYSSRVLELAKAMPAEHYDWRPMEGVSSVGEVYRHIAGANFSMLQGALDIPAPDGVDMENISSMTGKEEIVSLLEQSIQHVKESVQNMPDAKLREQTEIYGRSTDGQGVLVMLLSHMSEHVGQSIAYARMNEVVPPWSQ
ncbi:DinB family protein [Halalkalibaculum sp. DA3122]|uniref:DinB family protein n=1 Tax=unclassified Halalkalibaculum TaxID=2964617 RepID=UPI0037551003